MDTDTLTPVNETAGPDEAPASPAPSPEERRRQRRTMIAVGVGVVLILALTIVAILYLAQNPTVAENVRDIFIIFMALEFLLIGAALVILIVQLASLINLLQNEVKPILETTNETANTLRGTATFLSQHLSEPIIQLNSYVAALRRFTELLGLARKPKG